MSEKECFSFHKGHHLHHTKVDQFNQARMQVDITHVADSAFLVTCNGITEYWFHHNPDRLQEALSQSEPRGIEVTEDKRFLFVYTSSRIERFHMSQENLSECIHMNEKTAKHPEVASIIRQLHEENRMRLIERGISA
jgi:hypothetical protein